MGEEGREETGVELQDRAVSSPFLLPKACVLTLFTLLRGQDAVRVQANNTGFDCSGLLTGLNATPSRLGRDHTEKKGRAELYLCWMG